MARKGKAMEETTAEAATPQKGYVLAAPGSGALRWVCEACAPSHLKAGWRMSSYPFAATWLEAAQTVGLAPADAVLLNPVLASEAP